MNNMFTIPLDESMAQIVRCAVALGITMGGYAFFVIWMTHHFTKNGAGPLPVRSIAAFVSIPVSAATTWRALRFYPAIGKDNMWIVFFGCLVGAAVLAFNLSKPVPPPTKPGGVT